MPAERALLIECSACGIENLLPNIATGVPAFCNQCREPLLNPELVETHTGHSCDNCSMAFLLKKETGFVAGESECQCGSSDFSILEIDPFLRDLQNMEVQDVDEENEEDFDWCRSSSDELTDGDYNNIFDDDPGFAK